MIYKQKPRALVPSRWFRLELRALIGFVVMMTGSLVLLRVSAQDGDLDPAFGSAGKVTTNFTGTENTAVEMALQSDGKIVAVGYTNISGNNDFALARYDSNGNLDPGFGSGGKVTTDFHGAGDLAEAVALQSDGRIIVAGSTQGFNGPNASFALARYDSSGNLDTTFGSAGKVSTGFNSGPDVPQAVAIQSDGRIIAVGYAALQSGGTGFALARYDSSGNLDPSFGSGGKVITDFNIASSIGFDIALQSDGKIIAAGYSGDDFALARYDSNGNLDSTFGTAGTVTTDFSSAFSMVTNIALQSDGMIIAAGSAGDDFAVTRYDNSGNLDQNFGTGGKVVTDFFGGQDNSNAVALQADGKIIVGGLAFQSSNVNFALARYDANGNLDQSFGNVGKVTTDFFGFEDVIIDIAVQTDGKIVAAGYSLSNSQTSSSSFALARYSATPITYQFNGFFQPIENVPTLNATKAGKTVQVKFSLSGDQGPNIFASGYPKSQAIACDTTGTLGQETVTAGSLSYDATADRYTYLWNTDVAWVRSCRQFLMKLNDGTLHVANFKFTK